MWCSNQKTPNPAVRKLPILTIFKLSILIIFVTSVSKGYADDDFAKRYQAYQDYVKSGESFLKKGDYPAAIASLSKAIEMSAFEATTYYHRGIAFYKSGKENEAIKDFDRVIVLKPKMSTAFVYRGLCFEKMEKYEEAIRDYTSALKINRRDASIHNNLAWLYATAKDDKFQDKLKALEHAVRAAELSGGKNAEIQDTLARAYFINGKIGDAIETEKKALELEPNKELFKANLRNYEQHLKARKGIGTSSSAADDRSGKEEKAK